MMTEDKKEKIEYVVARAADGGMALRRKSIVDAEMETVKALVGLEKSTTEKESETTTVSSEDTKKETKKKKTKKRKGK